MSSSGGWLKTTASHTHSMGARRLSDAQLEEKEWRTNLRERESVSLLKKNNYAKFRRVVENHSKRYALVRRCTARIKGVAIKPARERNHSKRYALHRSTQVK